MKKITIFIAFMMMALWGKGQVDLYNGLIAYYPMDSNTIDASGNGNDGIMTGGGYASGAFGLPFTALSLGTGDEFTSEVLHKLEDEFSISFWFISYATSNANIMTWTGKAAPSDYDYFRFRYVSASTAYRTELEKLIGSGGMACDNDFADFAYTLVPDPYFYANYTLVRTSDSIHVYLNNVKVSSNEAVFSGCNSMDTLRNIMFGGAVFSGEIDNVLIYNRALNNAEVDSIYNLSAPLPAVLPSSSNSIIEKDVNIFPNPTSNIATVVMPEFGEFSIQIFDISGRLLQNYQINATEARINMSSFSKGFYSVKIIASDGRVFIKKLIRD